MSNLGIKDWNTGNMSEVEVEFTPVYAWSIQTNTLNPKFLVCKDGGPSAVGPFVLLSSPLYKQPNIPWSGSSDSCTVLLSITPQAAWAWVFLHHLLSPASFCVTYLNACSHQNGFHVLFEAHGVKPSLTLWMRALSYWLKVNSFCSDSLMNLVIYFDGELKNQFSVNPTSSQNV